MARTIYWRILQGLGANLYGQAVVSIIQLAGVPILLYAWGVQLYGEWLILFSIPAYLSIADLGFSQSAANDMTQKIARRDHAGALAVYQSLLALVYSAAGLGLLFITMLLFGLRFGHWLHFEELNDMQVRWVLWFLAAEVLVKLTEGASHAGFRSNGDYALHVSINYSALLLQYLGIWALALSGHGPMAAAGAFFAIRAVTVFLDALLLIYRHSWLKFSIYHARIAELRRLIHPALANLSMPLAMAMSTQGMVLVIGATLGALPVVVFSTLRTMTRLVLKIVYVISDAIEPEFASAYGLHDRNLLRMLYIHMLRSTLWLVLTMAIVLLFAGSWILDLWTHSLVAMNLELFYWLVATSAASALWYGGLVLLKAANKHMRASLLYVCTAFSAVILSWLIVLHTSRVADVGMVLLAMDGVLATYILRASGALCGISASRALTEAFNPLPLLKLAKRKVHAQ